MKKKSLVIDADDPSYKLNLHELYAYRELLFILAYRDFRVRYAQTFVGFFWAFLQPALSLGIFMFVFQRVIKVPTGGIPYPLIALTGIGVWTYFSSVMKDAGTSIILQSHMVKKIYFPRIIIPLSKSFTAIIELAVALSFCCVFYLYYQFVPPIQILFLPVFIFLIAITALGMGLWFSALSIRFYDFQHVIPFIVQIGMYLSPVVYSSSIVPEEYFTLYFINPVAGIIEGVRWCMIGGKFHNEFFISYCVAIILFVSGFIYFRKVERLMADYI